MSQPPHPHHLRRGVGLVEVLVALAIGSLATVGLLTSGLWAQQSLATRYHESVAGLLAHDLAERLRAHQGQAATPTMAATGYLAGAYDAPTFVRVDDSGDRDDSDDSTTAACASASDLCTPGQFAAADLAQWRRMLKFSLPDAQYSLTRRPDQSADLWLAWTSFSLALGQLSTATCPPQFTAPEEGFTRCLHLHIQP